MGIPFGVRCKWASEGAERQMRQIGPDEMDAA